MEKCYGKVNEGYRKNRTWELSELPLEKKPIGAKWIFKTKYKLDGEY